MPLAAAYFSAMSSRPLAPADAVAPEVSGPPATALRLMPPPPPTFFSDREFCDTYPSTSPTFTLTHAPSRPITSSRWPFFTVATTFPAALGACRTSSSGRFTHTSSASATAVPPAIASANAAVARRRPSFVFMFRLLPKCFASSIPLSVSVILSEAKDPATSLTALRPRLDPSEYLRMTCVAQHDTCPSGPHAGRHLTACNASGQNSFVLRLVHAIPIRRRRIV